MKRIVLELVFDEITEDEHTYLEFDKINTIVNDLTQDERLGIGERWIQSDWYHIEFAQEILLTAIDQNGDPDKGVWTKVDESGFNW